jgi:hypothetical protein
VPRLPLSNVNNANRSITYEPSFLN